MRFSHIKKYLFLISIGQTLTSPLSCAGSLVVPSEFDAKNGSVGLGHLSIGVEYQHIFLSDNFPKESPILITAVAFRVDDESAFGASYDAVVPRIQVKMSTFFKPLTEASRVYNNNRGGDEATVLDVQNLHLTGRYTRNTVNPFDLRVEFKTPFIFDPNTGHLLMYWKSEEGSNGIPGSQNVDAHFYNGGGGPGPVLTSRADGSSPLVYLTPIVSFDYIQVPEPATWVLIILGVIPLIKKSPRVHKGRNPSH
jgi:hypothetical protein